MRPEVVNTPDERDIEELKRRVGAAGIVTDSARASYETPARYPSGIAAAVVRPANAAEVSAVLAYCLARGLRVIPQAGHTGLALGGTPDASGQDIVLSVDRLKTVHHICPLDRTVTADAGVRLSALNDALEPYGLFLPIDLGADPMLGGMAATNTGGARFLRYGDMRAQVLDLEIVLAKDDAPVVRLGAGLRKDNTRLSLKDLVVGAGAAFGVITRVTAQVHPLPRQTAAALLVPSHPEKTPEIVARLEREAGELISALEGMSGAAMGRALDEVPGLRNPFGGPAPAYALLLELSTTLSPSTLQLDEALLSVLAPLVEGPDTLLQDVLVTPPSALWSLRHSLSEGLRRGGQVVGLDLAFRRDRVFAFRQAALRLLAQLGTDAEVCDFGHVADGGVHFNLVAPATTSKDELHSVRDALLDLAVHEFGGSFSGEHGLGPANQAAYDRYVPSEERGLAGEILAGLGVGACGHVRLGRSAVV
ncbi:FAD-binding oxidoreductase [Phenylobacterium sp.]|uniref:FAD-binding oxidoreductase n=1 Tax=Phenylobacterium sp. TaxID=1871053 RepID=UPI002EDB74D2